ncbi:intraflagellar transport protein 74 homolog [Ctenocephalides felis]|uniref:intraflagellar transport protein 74 homolog n=1 Tax=Ctenocephalides felis TaxID=7515 RepID=UPI000E6E1CF9|nr:intraflagellar transport protein 74 homolog [Ctenocephalides felis]
MQSSYGTNVHGAASHRPPTGRLGTASRLAMNTALPPKTATRFGTSISRQSQSILDRPITQHGISGLATASSGGGNTRQIQDRRYWEGVLQLKMRDLQEEIVRLQTFTQAAAREQSAKKHYDKKVKRIAAELTELQGKLADYNLVMENLSSGGDRSRMENQAQKLREQNEILQANVESVFEQRQKAEENMIQLEKQIEEENQKIMHIINEMPDKEKAKYLEMRSKNQELQQRAIEMQNELDEITKERDRLHVEISGSQLRLDAARLFERIRETEQKRQQLLEDQATRLTPAEEREKLLAQVREDNAAVSSMDKQMKHLNEEIKKKKKQLDQAEQDLEEGNGERHQKYIELRKRDDAMEEFLQSFPQVYDEEMSKLKELQELIVHCLSHSSLSVTGESVDHMHVAKDNFNSSESPTHHYNSMMQQLKKVQAMENKMHSELNSIMDTEKKMQQELLIVTDLHSLREKHNEHIQELLREKEMLKKKSEPTKNAVIEAQRKHDELKKTLEDNDMYLGIKDLQDKLSDLTTTVDNLNEKVQQMKSTTTFEDIKQSCLNSLNQYNEMLNIKLPTS